MRDAKTTVVLVEVDEEAVQPPLPNINHGDDNEEEEDSNEGISLGDHWNYYLLLILSAFALLLGQRMASGCDFIRRTSFSPDGGSNAITNLCQDAVDRDYLLNVTKTSNSAQQDAFEDNSIICEAFFRQHEYGFRMWGGQFFNGYTNDGTEDQACFSYHDIYIPRFGWIMPSFDAYFKASEVFSTLANICGSIPFFIMILMLCFPVQVVICGCRQQDEAEDAVPQAHIMTILRWFFLVAWVSQCLTFLIFASNICSNGIFFESLSDYSGNSSLHQHQKSFMMTPTMVDKVECSLGTGGNMSVAAAVLYFFCFCMAPVAIPPRPVTNIGRYQHQQELEGEQTSRLSQPDLLPTNATCSLPDSRQNRHHQGEYEEGSRIDFQC